MSNCIPCPPCEGDAPLVCEPYGVVTTGKRLMVEDDAFCTKTLSSPQTSSVLSYDNGIKWIDGSNNDLLSIKSGKPQFIDGSAAEPLQLASLQSNTGTSDVRIVTQQTDGTIRHWRPASSSATPRIAYDKNGVWEIDTMNNLLPSGNGIIIRDTAGNLATVPSGVSGSSLQMVGSNIQFVAAPSNQFPGGHIYGLIMSNNSTSPNNDVNIAAGECRSSDNTQDMLLTSVFTKQLNNLFALGTNAGGIVDSVIKQANSTYHAFVITNGNQVDVCFSAGVIPTGQPNYPAGFTKYRRIGAVTTDASANIRAFVQVGDRFLYTGKPVADASPASINVGGTLISLTVPAGIKVTPIVNAVTWNIAAYNTFYDPDSTWPPTSTPAGNNGGTNIVLQANGGYSGFSTLNGVMTNLLRQIGVDTSSNNTAFYLDTYGWFDQRGRLQP